MEILISVCFIISYMVLPLLFFHGKIFRRLRHPGMSLSLFGHSHGTGFSQEITCGLGALISLTGALCIVFVGRQWIICCYIVEKANRLWSFVFRTFRISWDLSRLVIDFLFSWWNWLGKYSSHIWNLVLLCLMCCIWREHNQGTFEDLNRSDDQLLALISDFLFDWFRVWELTSSDSLPLFLSSLFLCN